MKNIAVTIFNFIDNTRHKKGSLTAILFIVSIMFNNTVISKTLNNSNPSSDIKLTSQNITEDLLLADSIRNTDPVAFKKLLHKLTKVQDKFSQDQKNLYSYIYGYSLAYSGQFNEAETLFKSLLTEEINLVLTSRVNSILIGISIAKQNWTAGLQLVKTNINNLPLLGNSIHYQKSLIVIIQFYIQVKQFQLALSYINQLSTLKLTKKNNCLIKQLTLEAQFNLRKLTPEDEAISNAIVICQEENITIASNIIRIYKAKLYLANQEPNLALETLLPHELAINNTQYPMLIAEYSNTLAKAHWQKHNILETKNYTSKALDMNPNLTNLMQGIDTYKLLFQIAKAENNFKLSLEYYEKFAAIDKANLESEKARYIAFQFAEHQAYEQESQIKLLNEKNNSLAIKQALAETKVANRQLIILILILFILAFTVIGTRFWRTHKRVKELAEYDPLTGIFNRGHFTHVTNSALKYCQSADQDISLIMFDLDHFKKVNDNFGHACGDWALKETIKVCQSLGRKNDIFARLGGEEFCLVLPSCNIDTAMLRAEACRVAIEEIITEASGYDFSITASFGVTDAKRSGFELDKLLADADMAAYDSKNNGRNRVTIHQVPENKPEPLDNSWSL